MIAMTSALSALSRPSSATSSPMVTRSPDLKVHDPQSYPLAATDAKAAARA